LDPKKSKLKFPHHLEDGGVSLIDEPLILMSSLPIESSAMNLARGRSIGIVSDRHASVMACLNFVSDRHASVMACLRNDGRRRRNSKNRGATQAIAAIQATQYRSKESYRDEGDLAAPAKLHAFLREVIASQRS
jgi:hypothetical protein